VRWWPAAMMAVAVATAATGPHAADPPPPERFRAVVERPLFRPERRPPRPPPVPVAVRPSDPAVVEPPGLDFVGTLRRRDRLVALVAGAGPVRLRELGPGDRIAGWRVVVVEDDRLVLERDGRRVEYRLVLGRRMP